MAIDRAEVAAVVGPFVPDADAVVVEIFDVGVAGQEPEQLVHDRLHVQLLGGDKRKALAEIEAHLMAEHRHRAGAGAVALLGAISQRVLHQFEILPHRLAFGSAQESFVQAPDDSGPFGSRVTPGALPAKPPTEVRWTLSI